MSNVFDSFTVLDYSIKIVEQPFRDILGFFGEKADLCPKSYDANSDIFLFKFHSFQLITNSLSDSTQPRFIIDLFIHASTNINAVNNHGFVIGLIFFIIFSFFDEIAWVLDCGWDEGDWNLVGG